VPYEQRSIRASHGHQLGGRQEAALHHTSRVADQLEDSLLGADGDIVAADTAAQCGIPGWMDA